jgi:hypothetical protein
MLDANHSIPSHQGVVGRLMGRVNVVRGWRERGIARDISRDCLRIFRDLEVTQPRVRGVACYLEVVVRQAGLDPTAALDVIDGAYESFATWPIERALCLRDVAHYLAAQRCLADRPPEQGIVTHLAAVVDSEIPQGI